MVVGNFVIMKLEPGLGLELELELELGLELGLELWQELEHAVAGRSHLKSLLAVGLDSDVVVVSLSAAPVAPRFAIERIQRKSACQRRLEQNFPRNWKLLLVG